MDPSNFFFFVLPLAIIIAFLIAVVFYLSRKNEESNYEKEIKHLRKLLIKGKIDRKTFLYMRDNLKSEDLFISESKRLDEMRKHNNVDQLTYSRLKAALQMTYNNKIVKSEEKYNLEKIYQYENQLPISKEAEK